jgi:hypothetical protein
MSILFTMGEWTPFLSIIVLFFAFGYLTGHSIGRRETLQTLFDLPAAQRSKRIDELAVKERLAVLPGAERRDLLRELIALDSDERAEKIEDLWKTEGLEAESPVVKTSHPDEEKSALDT